MKPEEEPPAIDLGLKEPPDPEIAERLKKRASEITVAIALETFDKIQRGELRKKP